MMPQVESINSVATSGNIDIGIVVYAIMVVVCAVAMFWYDYKYTGWANFDPREVIGLVIVLFISFLFWWVILPLGVIAVILKEIFKN